MPAKVILEVVAGPIRGQTFVFEGHDTFLFGRGNDCHARLPKDGFVSRHHFLLETNPPDVRVRDLGSLNGTVVNDVKHGGRDPNESPDEAAHRMQIVVDLRHDDRVTVGNTSIVVQVVHVESCCRCGVEIPCAELASAEWADETWLCGDCRANAATAEQSDPPVFPTCCQNCGQDVSSELTAGRRGDYVCTSCRDVLSSSGGGLLQLVQQTAASPTHGSGLHLDGYELGDELGRGGMGVVYAARRKSDGRSAAVKVMLARVAVDRRTRQLFEREVDVTSQLRHPHIVELIESGSAGSIFYAVMEFCEHGSLQQLIRKRGPVVVGYGVPLLLDCLSGLDHAHNPPSRDQPRLVHRDLKPQNILVTERRGLRIAKIADFGLAKSFEMAGLSGMTATGAVGGTCHFMPREQLTNYKYVQPASDVWSLAASFYYALTGRPPLGFSPERDSVEVILRDEPIPIRQRDPSVPAALAEVFDRALATDLAVRYATAGEMKDALERALA